MSNGNAFEFNNTITGNNTQINQGQHVTASQTNTVGDTVTFEQFMRQMESDLSEVDSPQLATVEREILKPIRELAGGPEPESEQDRLTIKTRILAYCEQLEPYAPYVRKTLAAFAEGALSTMPPPASWVVAGCIEVIRDARRD